MKSEMCRSLFRFTVSCSKLTVATTAMLLVLLTGIAHSQSVQCYSYDPVKKTWVYNAACAGTTASPWQIAIGKTFRVNSSLTLSGSDNAQLNIGNGGTLGSAAYASATQFQPAGTVSGLAAVSSTSLTVGVGSRSLTVATGLGFTVGMLVTITSNVNGDVWMYGTVTSYNTNTGVLVVNVLSVNGSNTFNNWTVAASGAPGPAGPAGASQAPTGSLFLWAGTNLPTGFLWASGTSFTPCANNATYSALYTQIGDTWTTHNGCVPGTTFGIPDMRGVLPIGSGQGQTHEGGGTGTSRTLGDYGGAETHTQIIGELATHNHDTDGSGTSGNVPYGNSGITLARNAAGGVGGYNRRPAFRHHGIEHANDDYEPVHGRELHHQVLTI